jgi:hypothetical protein
MSWRLTCIGASLWGAQRDQRAHHAAGHHVARQLVAQAQPVHRHEQAQAAQALALHCGVPG